MHSPQINRVPKFGEELLAVGCRVLWSASVAHTIGTGNEDLCLWPLSQHLRQRSHEDVEPAIRLEIAGAVGDDFLPRRKAEPVGQPQARGLVRPGETRGAYCRLCHWGAVCPQSAASKPRRLTALRIRSRIAASASAGNSASKSIS